MLAALWLGTASHQNIVLGMRVPEQILFGVERLGFVKMENNSCLQKIFYIDKPSHTYSVSRFDCPFMKIRGPKLYGKFEPRRINSLVASKFNGEFCMGRILFTRNFIRGAAKFRPNFRCIAKFYGESAQFAKI